MADTNNIALLARGVQRGMRNLGNKVDVSQFLKNLIANSLPSQATRDTLQNITNVGLANRVKRVEAPDFTTDQLANMGGSDAYFANPQVVDYQDKLAESQFANQALQSELANPTANEDFNRIFNVSPEAQQRQGGEQMYGITPENPQGKFFSPTATRDMLGGAGMVAESFVPGLTQGMGGLARAGTNIAAKTLGSAGQGFGSSTPESAEMDTILSGLFGLGGSVMDEWANNPEFKQFIKDKNSGKYDAYIMYGDEIGNNDTKTGKTYQDLAREIEEGPVPEIPINKEIENIMPEKGTVGSPENKFDIGPGKGNQMAGQGKPLLNEDSFAQMIMNGEDPVDVLENMNFDEKDLMSDFYARNGDKFTKKSLRAIRDFANKYSGTLQDLDEETRKKIYENYKKFFKK